MSRNKLISVLALALSLVVQQVAWTEERPSFTDITKDSGIARLVDDYYESNPTWWLSGLHLVDLDGDGDLDLFLSAHGKGAALAALNDGSGRFAKTPGEYPDSEIHLCYDSDEDGKLDLTMTYQDGGGQWWRNRSKAGEPLFEPTGITRGTNTARRQAMIDINRDGNVDWLRGTDSDIQFDFGDGKGFFSQGSYTLAVTRGRDEILCLPQDIDDDGDIDLLAEWGHYSASEGNSRIYRNDGTMIFTDMTAEAGLVAAGTAIKGVGDVDHDGDSDLICLERKNFEIYLNDGNGRFVKKPEAIQGIGKGASSASWGIAVTTDFDNDGVTDILANGRYFLKVLHGTGGGPFECVNSQWGIADISAASIDDGLCFGDIDADGDLDIVGYTSINGQRRFAVYRNDLPARNWLRIRPIGSLGNRGAAGAKIRVYTQDEGRLLWYEQVTIYGSQAAASYYSLPVTERHFGLGNRESVDVSVEFYPSRRIIRRRGVTANKVVEINEQPSAKTDRGVYSLPPAPTLPKAGGVFTDPTFGTEIMRITDEQDGRENCNAYSYWPSFNIDSTRFHIACGNRHVLHHFDPEGFRLTGKEPLFARKPPNGHQPRWEDAMWAYADPNLLYCHEGLNLWAYDTTTSEYTLVKDFSNTFPPGHLCQLSKDSHDDVFAGSLQDQKWNRTGYFVWRRATDKIVLRETVDHDEVQIDKTGRFCVVKTGRQGKGVVEVRVVDLHSGEIEDLTDDGPDFAPGHSDNGQGIVVGHDNVRNRVTFRRLDSPHDVRTLLDFKNDWSQDYHVSMLADDESWATLSFYVGNSLPSSGIFRNEIAQVATDGSGRVRRLAHHRSVFKSYWDSPRANISRDGRFIIFTSNWEGTDQRDVFILRVPAG